MATERPGGSSEVDPVFDWLYIDDDEADPSELTVVEVEEEQPRSLEGHYQAPARRGLLSPGTVVTGKFLAKVTRDIIKHNRHCPECEANTDPRKVPVHPGCHCDVVTKDLSYGADEDMANRWKDAITATDPPVIFVPAEREGDHFAVAEKEVAKEEGDGKESGGEAEKGGEEDAQKFAKNPNWPDSKFAAETTMAFTLEDARWSDIEEWLADVAPYVETGQFLISMSVGNVRTFGQFEDWLHEIEAHPDEHLPGVGDGNVIVISLVQAHTGFESAPGGE